LAMENEGGCVCGAVRFGATGEALRVTICHYSWCPRRTGSAFGIKVVYREDQVALTGDTVSTYRHVFDESGRWLDVAFCGRCGSNLGFTLEAAPGFRTIPAGAFDDPSQVSPERQEFRHVYT
jgi:hypothetical protein